MEALRIDFYLATPMIKHERLLHLDALLAARKAEIVTAQGGSWQEAIEDLPLARIEHESGEWVWSASALHCPSQYQHVRHMTRKTNMQQIELDRKESGSLNTKDNKISLSSGPDRNWFWFTALSDVPLAQAWCIGVKDEISELLNGLHGIGKNHRNGHGQIERIDVVPDKAAEHKCMQRVMPWPGNCTEPLIAACKAPYYAPENQQICYANPALFC